jgi:L,D-peptidoglycan transpeptidase YkuD (ErfK/YbiS/YcfS/YnhG family)
MWLTLLMLIGAVTVNWTGAALGNANTEIKNEAAIFQQLQAGTNQLLVVDSVDGVQARLRTFEKIKHRWSMKKSFAAVVGSRGVAKPGAKREGDKRTPAGIFPLTETFGYADRLQTKMPYRQSTEDDKFIDDRSSPDYNRWIQGPTSASSFEKMRRNDDLYEFGAIIDYNRNPVVPGLGSAIFLHVWENSKEGTAGCVALDKNNLVEILKWLDPAQKPHIAIH